MSTIVTEDETRRSLTMAATGWVATRGFDVTGVASDLAALTAIGSNGINVPIYNESHDICPGLKAMSITADTSAPNAAMYRIAVYYSVPNSGGAFIDQNLDPLKQKTRVSMSLQTSSESVTNDISGNPILNQAGDGVDPIPREFGSIFLQARQNRPYLDMGFVSQFSNTVNSAPFKLGKLLVAAGQAKCRSISLDGEHAIDASYASIVVDIQIVLAPPTYKNPKPFWARIKNQGSRGWYSDSGTTKIGEICLADGTPAASDVALDKQGKPIDATMKVLKNGSPQSPVANPNLVKIIGAELDDGYQSNSALAYYYRWKLYREVDFAGLNL